MQVTHSERGAETLSHFLLDVCGLKSDWQMQNVLEKEIKEIADTVGPDDHIICALSGVDSAVASALVHRAVGDRLHCVFVDNGLGRYAL